MLTWNLVAEPEAAALAAEVAREEQELRALRRELRVEVVQLLVWSWVRLSKLSGLATA